MEQTQTMEHDNKMLRQTVEQLQGRLDKALAIQNEVQQLINAPAPEKIVHDLRNVLNELTLLRAIAGTDE